MLACAWANAGCASEAENPPVIRKPAIEPRMIQVSADLEPVDAVPAGPGALAGCNLLLVTFDTTRADRIGCYGNDALETPSLDSLAATGILFSNAIAPAPITLPSHASMMTGLYPFHHGARTNGTSRLTDDHVTLAEILSDRGYATAAVVSAVVLGSQFGIDQGFEVFEDETDERDSDRLLLMPQRSADRTTQRARSWLAANAAGPFFLWVHYFDPHFPYEPPQQYLAAHRHPYDGEIAFTDAQLGVLLDLVDELGLNEKTLVVVAGDHGEGLGHHGEATHAALVYGATMHVPFLMRCGGRLGRGVNVERLVSLVDLTPTVLSLLGITVPGGLDGMDLTRPPQGDRPVYVETLEMLSSMGWAPQLGVYHGTLKYIHGSHQELYDLAADPLESRDLAADRPDAAAAMRQRLTAFYGQDLEGAIEHAVHQPSAETLAQLQALGYLGSAGAEVPPPELRLDPKDMLPLVLRMYAAIAQYRDQGAGRVIASLESLVAEHPEFVGGYEHLGQLYARSGDLAKAEAAYARRLELCPGNALAMQDLAWIKLTRGHVEEAMELYERVFDRIPDYFSGMSQLGRTLMSQGEYALAAGVITEALQLRPGDRRLPDQFATSMVATGRRRAAIDFLTTLLPADPRLPAVRNALAGLLVEETRYAEAVAILEEGIEREPDQLELINNLAILLAGCPDPGLRRPADAAQMMERVCRLTSDKDPRYLYTLATVYAAMLRLDDAIATAEKARRLATASPDRRYNELAPRIGQGLALYRAMKEQSTP